MKFFWLVLACAIASRAAVPATVAMLSLNMVGVTAAIGVELVRDLAVLLLVLFLSLLTAPAHRMAHLPFVAAALVVLAVGEAVFSVRSDIVMASWQLPRIVGRLSAALFAITLASYADLVAERPRGELRTIVRLGVGAAMLGFAWPLTFLGRAGFEWLALFLGIDARWQSEPPRAFIAEPESIFARIALLSEWPDGTFPAQWRADVLACGATPEAVLFVTPSQGHGLPGTYLIG
jgi:hypothetical protein